MIAHLGQSGHPLRRSLGIRRGVTESQFVIGGALVLLVFIGWLLSSSQDAATSSVATAASGSCQEKITHAIAKAEKANAKYNAFTEITSLDVALREAQRLDALPLESRGRLHCLTASVKDNIGTSTEKWGLSTSAGSAALKSLLKKQEIKSAKVVQLIEHEGAIIIGKANMDDFALQYHSYSTAVGQTLNCHDPHRYPGGSSGGSAVSVSLGLVDFSLGTDTGGSVRIPASFMGITGLRPSQDRISTKGVIPLSNSRDTVGPLAQTVDLAQQVYEVISNENCTPRKTLRKVAIARDLFTEEKWRDMQKAIQLLRSEFEAEIVTDNLPDSITRTNLLKQTKSASMYEFQPNVEQYLVQLTGSRVSLVDIIDQTRGDCAKNGGDFACEQIVDSLEKKVKTAGSIPSSVKSSWRSFRSDLKTFLDRNGFSAIAFPAFTANPTKLSLHKKQEFCPNNRVAAITGFPSLVVFAGFSKKHPNGLELVGLDECELFELGKQFEAKFGQSGACEHK